MYCVWRSTYGGGDNMKYIIEFREQANLWRESIARGYPKGGFESLSATFTEVRRLREKLPVNHYRIVSVPHRNREVVATFTRGMEDEL